MRCPHCQSEKTICLDSRPQDTYTRRRRQCKSCKQRFTTLEVVAIEAKGQIATQLIGKKVLHAMEEAVANMRHILDEMTDDDIEPFK